MENLISIPHTEAPKLSRDLEAHVRDYDVDIFTAIKAHGL